MKIRVIVWLVLSTSINSCLLNNCVKVGMNKSDLEWYNQLPNMGDTLFYKGSDNTVDTFLISNKYRYYMDCNSFEVSKYQPETFGLTGDCLNKNVKYSFYNFFQMEFSKDTRTKTSESAVMTFRNLDASIYINHKKLSDFKKELIKNTFLNKNLETIKFDNELEHGSSTYSVKIKSFNWNKELGLVRYMTTDSVVYDYWKKR